MFTVAALDICILKFVSAPGAAPAFGYHQPLKNKTYSIHSHFLSFQK